MVNIVVGKDEHGNPVGPQTIGDPPDVAAPQGVYMEESTTLDVDMSVVDTALQDKVV